MTALPVSRDRPQYNCWNPTAAPTVWTQHIQVYGDHGPPDVSGALGQTQGFVQWRSDSLAIAWARKALALCDADAMRAAEAAYPVGPDNNVPAWTPGGPDTPAMRVLAAFQAAQFVYMSLNLQASGDPEFRLWWRRWFSGVPLDLASLSAYSAAVDYDPLIPSVPMESSISVPGLANNNNALRVKGAPGPNGEMVDDQGVPWTPLRIGELRYRTARRFRQTHPNSGFTVRFFSQAFVDFLSALETCRHPLDGRGPFEDISNSVRAVQYQRLLWEFSQCAPEPLGPRGFYFRTQVYLANGDVSHPVVNLNSPDSRPAWTSKCEWTGSNATGVGNLEDAWSVVIGGAIPDTWRMVPLDAWSADTADFSLGGEPYLSMSPTLRDLFEAVTELANILQAAPDEIVLRARIDIVSRNLLTLRATGGLDATLQAFASSDAAALSAQHAGNAGFAALGTGLLAAAGVSALVAPPAGLAVSVVLTVLGAGVKVINGSGAFSTLVNGTSDTVPRDEFGVHKPWIQQAWISGDVDGPLHSVPALEEFGDLSAPTGGALASRLGAIHARPFATGVPDAPTGAVVDGANTPGVPNEPATHRGRNATIGALCLAGAAALFGYSRRKADGK